jgi:hypothetical protein
VEKVYGPLSVLQVASKIVMCLFCNIFILCNVFLKALSIALSNRVLNGRMIVKCELEGHDKMQK